MKNDLWPLLNVCLIFFLLQVFVSQTLLLYDAILNFLFYPFYFYLTSLLLLYALGYLVLPFFVGAEGRGSFCWRQRPRVIFCWRQRPRVIFLLATKAAGGQRCFGGRSAMHRCSQLMPEARSFLCVDFFNDGGGWGWFRWSFSTPGDFFSFCHPFLRRLCRWPLVMFFFRYFFLFSDTSDCWLLFYFCCSHGERYVVVIFVCAPFVKSVGLTSVCVFLHSPIVIPSYSLCSNPIP